MTGTTAERRSRPLAQRLTWLAIGLASTLLYIVGARAHHFFLEPTHFHGDVAARGARVYVDGKLIGMFDTANAFVTSGGSKGFSFDKHLSEPSSGGEYLVVVVLASGDSLTTRYRDGDSGGVGVVAQESRIYTYPHENVR